MPTDHIWIGGAPRVSRVVTVTIPADIEAGMNIRASIGTKNLDYTVPAGKTTTEIATLFAAAWNASTTPEFEEITAAVGTVAGTLTLTADSAGVPFIVTLSMSGATNEKQTVTIGNSPIGGTFTLSYGGEVTAGIAYNATANDVETALEALSTIGSGNVSVTGDAGGPFTVEFIGGLAGVNVDTLGANSDGLTVTPEVQVIDLGGATGGTFTVKYNTGGTPTSALAYNISAANLQTALEGLAEIVSGDVSVTGSDGGPFTITFQGNFNGINAGNLIIDGTSLTGGLYDDVTITEQTAGGGGGNEVWSIYGAGSGADGIVKVTGSSSVSGGTFDILIELNESTLIDVDNIPYDVTAAEFQTLIDSALAGLGVSSHYKMMIVSGYGGTKLNANSQLSAGRDFAITVPLIFGDNEAGTSGTILTVDSTNLTGGAYGDTDISSNTFNGADQGYGSGPWKITVNGEQTGELSDDLDAADLQTELEGLSAIGAGNVLVEPMGPTLSGFGGISGAGYRITLQGDLANQSTGLSFSAANVSGSTHNINIYENWEGAAGTSEVQRITITGSPSSGEFTISFAPTATTTGASAAIPYDATASELQTILEAVDTIGAGNVSCSGGPFPGDYIDVTFTGSLSGTDLTLMAKNQGEMVVTTEGGTPATVTVDTIQIPITAEETTANSGPNNWDIAANWSTNSVPETGDTVYIGDTEISILYGLDQSAVTLAEMYIDSTFTGFIGLNRINSAGTTSFFEYRETYLKVSATVLTIGNKDGDGSPRVKINLGSNQSTVLIKNSGTGEDSNVPAILLLGSHASNVIDINRGSLGVAYYPTETATVATLRQAFFDDADADTDVYIGENVTIGAVVKSGGTLELNSATTTISQTGGEITINAGAHPSLDIVDGDCNYNSTGTAVITINGTGALNFNQDRRPKTITSITKQSEACEIFDDSGCIAAPVIIMDNVKDYSKLHFAAGFTVTLT